MRIHKFDRERSIISKPKTIHWIPFVSLEYPPIKVNPVTWKIFAQTEITLNPGQVFNARLGLGFMLTKGVILTSLDYHLKYKKCSLQNEVSFGEAEDIFIAIINNSKERVIIKENDPLCFVHYRV